MHIVPRPPARIAPYGLIACSAADRSSSVHIGESFLDGLDWSENLEYLNGIVSRSGHEVDDISTLSAHFLYSIFNFYILRARLEDSGNIF